MPPQYERKSAASMLLLRRPCSKSSGQCTNSTQQRDSAADRPGQAHADQEDVDEGHRAEQRVPEPDAELVVRQQAEADRRGDDPELERRLLEKGFVFVRTALGRQPVADFEDAIDREGVDGFVVPDISAAETDEQRQAEQRERESQPGPADGQPSRQVTSLSGR